MRARKVIPAGLVLVCLLALVPGAAGVPAVAAPPALAAVTARTAAEVRALGAFDLAEARHGDAYDVVLWPGDAARLEQLGLPYEILIPDLVAHDEAIRREDARAAAMASSPAGGGAVRTAYRRLADYESELRALAVNHPGHVRLVQGAEPTLEGRTVLGVEIAADVARQDGRPTSFIMGLHHAREWPSAELTMDLATELAERFGVDPALTALLEDVRVLLVPVVNPDGFHHSREHLIDNGTLAIVAGGQGGYWRKNRRGLAHAGGESVGSFGVDPNRNYAFQWGSGELGEGSSWVPVQGTYHGTGPFSEPETRNIKRMVLERNVITLLTNHTYSQLVLWPWGHTGQQAPDAAGLQALGTAMARLNGYAPMQSIGLYPTTGTTEDWAYVVTGAYGYTFEIGREFHPPYSQVPALYQRNRAAFLLLIEAAADPPNHSILMGRVTDPDGSPVAATLRLRRAGETPLWEDGDGSALLGRSVVEVVDLAMTAEDDGGFSWHVGPSRRPIGPPGEAYTMTVSAPGFGEVTMQVQVARGQKLDLGTIVLPG